MVYYNPLDLFCKSTTGAVCETEEITFRVKTNSQICQMVIKKDGEDYENFIEMKEKDGYFETALSFNVGLYFYYFILENGIKVGLNENYLGEETNNPKLFQLTSYKKGYKTPNFIKGGLIYQIFPDRFCRAKKQKKIEDYKVLHENWNDIPVFEPNENGKIINNDFFGGDFLGIASKLNYLKSLGVTTIYLNPIFKAYSNHRYDTGDYMQVDSLLGTEKDFENLIEKANEKGINIILDGVFNHTGDDSVYFNKYGRYGKDGAYINPKSKYRSWFKFTNYPTEYQSWWGITTLPALNKNNKHFIKYICGKNGVLKKWLSKGVAGYRLDVVDELPEHFVKEIRKSIKSANKNAIIIGEVWEDASNKIAYGVRRKYFQGRELDSVMNYPLKNAIINFVLTGDEKQLSYTIKEQIDHYPKMVLDCLMNMLSTHDTFRIFSALSGINVNGKTKKELSELEIPLNIREEVFNRLKIATLLQYTLCGVPSIYYGDEVGMQGYTDPLNRKTLPWGNEDKKILNWYKKLGSIRKKYNIFLNGELKELYSKNGLYVFSRVNKFNKGVIVAVNCGERNVEIRLEKPLYNLLTNKKHAKKTTIKSKGFALLANIQKK